MNWFSNLWTWFDGKKSVIALIALFLTKTLTGLETDVLGQQVPAIDAVIGILNQITTIFGVLGLGHKAVKVADPVAK